MKILFLDFDGVLNNSTYKRGFDPRCMAQLARVIERTKCQIVLSTSWKMHFYAKHLTLRGFEILFKTHGVHLTVAGVTGSGNSRLDEIYTWLDAHDHDAYAIVDDWIIDDEFAARTDGRMGLTAVEADKLIEILL